MKKWNLDSSVTWRGYLKLSGIAFIIMSIGTCIYLATQYWYEITDWVDGAKKKFSIAYKAVKR